MIESTIQRLSECQEHAEWYKTDHNCLLLSYFFFSRSTSERKTPKIKITVSSKNQDRILQTHIQPHTREKECTWRKEP